MTGESNQHLRPSFTADIQHPTPAPRAAASPKYHPAQLPVAQRSASLSGFSLLGRLLH